MTARGNCVSCGSGLDETGFCWKCSGDGPKPEAKTVAAPRPREQPEVTNYPKEIRQLIQRALYCACLPDKSLAVQICRELEKRIPGVGWASVASELEAMRMKKAEPRPMAQAIVPAVNEVPF